MKISKLLSIKAIFIGLIVSVCAYIAAAIITFVGFFFTILAPFNEAGREAVSFPLEADKQQAYDLEHQKLISRISELHVPIMMGSFAVSTIILLLTGYMVGRIAKHAEPLNASIMGFLLIILGYLPILAHRKVSLDWLDIGGIMIGILVPMAGGYFALKRKQRLATKLSTAI